LVNSLPNSMYNQDCTAEPVACRKNVRVSYSNVDTINRNDWVRFRSATGSAYCFF